MSTDTVEFEVARVDESVIDGQPIIHCFGYTADGEHVHTRISGFEPYFYVPYDEVSLSKPAGVVRFELYDENGNEFETIRERRVAKVVTRLPSQIPDVKKEFSKAWESDVMFPTRFITDIGLKDGLRAPDTNDIVPIEDIEPCSVTAEWRVHVMDIEVDDRAGFPQDGNEPILCITAYDSFMDTYITWIQSDEDSGSIGISESYEQLHDSDVQIRVYDSEIKMLQSYFSFVSVSKPSVLCGWNVEDFDMEYLIDRSEQLELEHEDVELPYDAMSPIRDAQNHNFFGPRVKGLVIFDLLLAFKRRQFTEMDSYRLDAVGETVVGKKKEQYIGKVGQLWEDDPSRLVEYNLRDVELCVEIDRREELIAFAAELKSFVGSQLDEAIIESTLCDRYVLNDLHGDRVLPDQSSGESKEFAGATVFEPATGIKEFIPALDLKSLYPMSMVTLNASPETKVDPDSFDGPMRQSPIGVCFREDKEGITRNIIEELLEHREQKKAERDEYAADSARWNVLDRQQTAVKVVMNALYGVMAWSRFRLYDVDVAAAVTATGRAVIRHTGQVAQEMGYEVLYGDTDSILLDIGDVGSMEVDEIVAQCFEIEDEINQSYTEFSRSELNTEKHRFEIEFEKLYRRFFQAGSKKRYAGNIVWKEGQFVDETDITGFEYKRSDNSEYARQLQKEVIQMIVHGESLDDVTKLIQEKTREFERREVSLDEIGIPQGIGKALNKFDRDTHTARGAKYGNLLLGTSFAQGSKPKRYYLNDVHESFFTRMEDDGLDIERDMMFREFYEDGRNFVICAERASDLAPELELDWERMMWKNVREVTMGIMETLGVPWDDIVSQSQQSGLDAFA